LLHGGFARFNSADVRRARPTVKQSRKLVQLRWGTYPVDLNAAVVLVPDPAAEADSACMFRDEPPEADALHAPGYKPGAGFDL
jgi:hypothetical protein